MSYLLAVSLASASLAILVYTYFLYPLVIAFLARARPQKLRRDPGHTPRVSALIPVYNAEAFIADKLESLLAMEYPDERFEILLLSDASTDKSDEILQDYAKRYPERIRVFRSEERGGKPRALNRLRKEAKGDVFFMTDIRQKVEPRALRELVSHLADDRVGAVSGNLELVGGAGAGMYWKYEKWIRQSEAKFRSLVGVTGAIYALRASDLPDIPETIVLDDMWVPMRLRLQGKGILFAKAAIAYDQAFEDGREFQRKTRTLAGNYQLLRTMPKLLIPFVNPSWFETISHKVMRLVCPWALLLLAVMSAFMLSASASNSSSAEFLLALVLCAGQALFYLLAIVGKGAGKLGNLCRTFVVMNYAALVGLGRYWRSSQKITW